MPDQQYHLAMVAQHKPQTQAMYKTNLGWPAVRNLVAMENINVNLPWTADETKELTEIFQAELDIRAIQEQETGKHGVCGTSNRADHK